MFDRYYCDECLWCGRCDNTNILEVNNKNNCFKEINNYIEIKNIWQEMSYNKFIMGEEFIINEYEKFFIIE